MASPPRAHSSAFSIVSNKYPPIDGGGAYRFGSRWVNPGRQVIHAAETYSLAVLENLVHWQTSALPKNLICVEALIPDDVSSEFLAPQLMPVSDENDFANFRAIGDSWYDRGESLIFRVPSVVSRFENNLLINQTHLEFNRIQIQSKIPVVVDPRLFPSK